VKIKTALLLAIAGITGPAHSQSYAVQEIRIEQPRIEQPRVEQPRLVVPKLSVPALVEPRLVVPKLSVPTLVEPRLVLPKMEELRPEYPRPVLTEVDEDSFWRNASRAVAVSDFKNGIYMLNGKRVAYSDLWQPTHGHGEVVPGVGWTYTKNEAEGGQYWVPATPVVNQAVLSDAGFTVVMDCSIYTPDVEGSATVGVMASVFDSNMDKFSIAGAFHDPPSWGGTGGTPPWITTTDGGGPTKQFITLGDMYRFAANLGPEEYLSVEGGPVRHQPATDWGNLNAFYLFATFESSWTVPQIVVVERIALYRLQNPSTLPRLSTHDGGNGVPGVVQGETGRLTRTPR
jgi:hypothetical protein